MRITGGCLCGAIRFEGGAEPQFQVTRYCKIAGERVEPVMPR
jgi:hypothetical protein